MKDSQQTIAAYLDQVLRSIETARQIKKRIAILQDQLQEAESDKADYEHQIDNLAESLGQIVLPVSTNDDEKQKTLVYQDKVFVLSYNAYSVKSYNLCILKDVEKIEP